MASKDKTSKTARVMNLLSKKPDSVEEGEPAAAAPVPPIVSSLAADDAVADQIKNALEGALEQEAGPVSDPVPPEPTAQETEPDPAQPPAVSAPEAEAALPPEPAGDTPSPDPQPEPAASAEPEPQPTPAADFGSSSSAPGSFTVPASPGYINVMQVLVEEKAPKYVKMFGLCQCQRCLEDVKALTLNHLPPKYVVLEQGDMIPRLTVYEGRYSSDITAQLLHACKVVMQTPHHNR